jgi:hypothetical protein
MAKNAHRRMLTTSQRAMIAARMANLAQGQRPTPDKTTDGGNSPQLTTRHAAKIMMVAPDTVKDARRLLREAAPELIEWVRKGEMTVHHALEQITKRPPAKKPEEALPPAIIARTKDFMVHVADAARRGDLEPPSDARVQLEYLLVILADILYEGDKWMWEETYRLPGDELEPEVTPKERIRRAKSFYEKMNDEKMKNGGGPVDPDIEKLLGELPF